MVEGIHRYLDRALAEAPQQREQHWQLDFAQAERLRETLSAHRQRLRKILGLVDDRLSPRLDYVGGPGRPPLLAEAPGFQVLAVRWAVLPGVDAEGLLLEPTGDIQAVAVVLPDADWTPEMIVGLVPGLPPVVCSAPRLAQQGVRVLVPCLINRQDDLCVNHRLQRATNQSHREFIHRMAFELGRTLPGYEIQQALAGIDWLTMQTPEPARLRVAVVGYGEGAWLARFLAALDERIRFVAPFGHGGPLEAVWEEPFDRDLWGLVRYFGTAELTVLTWPRMKLAEPVVVEQNGRPQLRLDVGWPRVEGPPPVRPGRSGAAPGRLRPPSIDAITAEETRARRLLAGRAADDPHGRWLQEHLPLLDEQLPTYTRRRPQLDDPKQRHQRLFNQLVNFTQKLWRDSEAVRRQFWSRAQAASPQMWEQSCDSYRDYFHREVIGQLPTPTVPMQPRTRKLYDEPTWTGYEVMLDVYPDVFAYGILLIPKGLSPQEKRPLIVCQHGLEGTPRHTIDSEKRPVYNQFARRLVELGYIVYAPQNPYYGQTRFRQIQRKAHLLQASLFSFIIRQHQRTLDWLETLPFVERQRIAFYGLSYGGKTAMRVPAIEKRYCLSICSADFNEWVGKCVSYDLDRSYMWTMEYDMYEFDLGHTFNYAEMAYLIAPRPFMVERGHDDGVGTDEMVAYEYAKVRYLYQNRLKIPERTAIEFFPGGHQIHFVGTREFLKRHLGR
jgi:dienelactone hydrolase